MKALPRLRMSRVLVDFHPGTRERIPLANWTAERDAQEVEADIGLLLNRYASPAAAAALSSTDIYMARLNGASGHTAEEPQDPRRFVIYIDPFRATGRLHAAATLVHELAHVELYRRRGFHANRTAAVLRKQDFLLLGTADELTAYDAEASFVATFLDRFGNQRLRAAARKALLSVELRWPVALVVLLGLERLADPAARMKSAREQIVLDLHRQASRYWDIHRWDRLPAALETAIRDWHTGSNEWKSITSQREDWLGAGAHVQ